MKFIYPAVFRKQENGGYHAFFPDLECCEAEGETLDRAGIWSIDYLVDGVTGASN